MRRLRTLRAVFELAGTHLRRDAVRTVLAIFGVCLAVVATTVLTSVGYGVLATGEEKFDAADRDIWISGEPVRLAPGSVGGFTGGIQGSHRLAAEIRSRDDVRTAVPMLFQTVYVGSNPGEVQAMVATGVPGAGGSSVTITDGRALEGGREHYSNGEYNGSLSREVLVSARTAEQFDVGVGDTLFVGGTVAGARQYDATVVGVSPTFSRFLGAPTVTLPLSELQTLTGAAQTDEATLLTVSVTGDADVTRVEQRLETAYPQYDVRTNREQLTEILGRQALVLASGVALVVLAIVAGLALTGNLLWLLVHQQARSLAALQAAGVSQWTLIGFLTGQGLLLGALGGAAGLVLTPVLVAVLNGITATVIGFEGLVRTPRGVYALGAVIAICIGTISATVAGWQVARLSLLDRIRT